jgi:hypothetical protein
MAKRRKKAKNKFERQTSKYSRASCSRFTIYSWGLQKALDSAANDSEISDVASERFIRLLGK